MNAIKVKDPLCSSRTVMMYADGELDAPHAVEVESHLRACTECHDELDTVRAMRASIRRSTSRKAPSGLEERCSARLAEALAQSFAAYDASVGGATGSGVGHALHAAEAKAVVAGPGQRRWTVFAFVAAAACFALVVVAFRSDEKGAALRSSFAARTGIARGPSSALAATSARATAAANENAAGVDFDALLDQLVAFHANPLPPDAKSPEELTKFDPWVGVPVKRSALTVLQSMGACPPGHLESCRGSSFAGGRIHPVRDARGAAALQYRLQGHRLTVYIFDPRVVRMGETHLRSRMVRQAPIYVGKMRGFSVAAAERSGVGYALASDLDEDKSIQMVASF
jgi:anti-sigma factor RsiW